MGIMEMENRIEEREWMAYSDGMAKQEYTAVFKKQGGWIIAWIEEIPGVNTQGRTMKKARENLREALSLILEENRAISARKHRNVRREKLIVAGTK